MNYSDFVEMTTITKGWSKEEKYFVKKEGGEKFFLRVSEPNTYKEKENFFNVLKKLSKLNITFPRPIEFGKFEKGVYYLEEWIDGEGAEKIIPSLDRNEQYRLGISAGKALKEIHSIPAPDTVKKWEKRFNKKIDRKIKDYKKCKRKFHGGDKFINYIKANRKLIENRPQCFQHGDFHMENMMVADNKIVIIDFNRFDYGDPWEEFNRIIWTAKICPVFATGIIDGYFENDVPEEFWRLLLLYAANNTLASISWANKGISDFKTMMDYAEFFYETTDGMERIIPSWYNNMD